MGIPSYFSYIAKNYQKILRKGIPVENFYMDCNSIVYDAYYAATATATATKPAPITDEYIISKTIQKIDEYIHALKPSNLSYIAFDGVAPVAKMEQQRTRRHRSYYQSLMMKTSAVWDTVCITPGTQFMKSLSSAIHNHYIGKKNVIVSCADEPGEGEHKIFEHIRKHPGQQAIIYGLDADLIMLALNHLEHVSSIYLYRETPHYIQNINRAIQPNQTYFVDIKMLADEITVDVGNVRDYILMCFMLGNDFLPHFPALNIRTHGIQILTDTYRTVGKQLTAEGGEIVWESFTEFIRELAKSEEAHIVREHQMRCKKWGGRLNFSENTREERERKIENLPILDRTVEIYIAPDAVGWEARYYDVLFSGGECDVEKVCANYYDGLEWTLKYYTTGCIDWKWKYNYAYPPLLTDLAKHLRFRNNMKLAQMSPVNPDVQLAYVLPPVAIRKYLGSTGERLLQEHPEWFEEDVPDFLWAYCRYFWEAHINLPEICVYELELAVSEVD